MSVDENLETAIKDFSELLIDNFQLNTVCVIVTKSSIDDGTDSVLHVPTGNFYEILGGVEYTKRRLITSGDIDDGQ